MSESAERLQKLDQEFAKVLPKEGALDLDLQTSGHVSQVPVIGSLGNGKYNVPLEAE